MANLSVQCCLTLALISANALAGNTPAPPAVSKAADIVQPDKDWKFFGPAGSTKKTLDFFYLPSTLKVMQDGTIQVWTKELDDAAVRKIDRHIQQHQVILNQAAAKIAQYYHPPFADMGNLGVKDAMWITEFEIIADNEAVAPDSKVLLDIDCANQQYRYLTIVATKKNGDPETTDQAGAWVHVVPESVTENLTRLVCPSAQ
ncbi:MAG TPA: hypothetical protein VFU49_00935 [Ktedonobacteraceae bacterium]|nr:hypothetical protein [Ktedonobacteraceae bacterium]